MKPAPTVWDALVFLAVPLVFLGVTVAVAVQWLPWKWAWFAGLLVAMGSVLAYLVLGLIIERSKP